MNAYYFDNLKYDIFGNINLENINQNNDNLELLNYDCNKENIININNNLNQNNSLDENSYFNYSNNFCDEYESLNNISPGNKISDNHNIKIKNNESNNFPKNGNLFIYETKGNTKLTYKEDKNTKNYNFNINQNYIINNNFNNIIRNNYFLEKDFILNNLTELNYKCKNLNIYNENNLHKYNDLKTKKKNYTTDYTINKSRFINFKRVDKNKLSIKTPNYIIPPFKKRALSHESPFNLIKKYYDNNFIMEEDNEEETFIDDKYEKKHKKIKEEKRVLANNEELNENISIKNENLSLENQNIENIIQKNNLKENFNVIEEKISRIENNDKINKIIPYEKKNNNKIMKINEQKIYNNLNENYFYKYNNSIENEKNNSEKEKEINFKEIKNNINIKIKSKRIKKDLIYQKLKKYKLITKNIRKELERKKIVIGNQKEKIKGEIIEEKAKEDKIDSNLTDNIKSKLKIIKLREEKKLFPKKRIRIKKIEYKNYSINNTINSDFRNNKNIKLDICKSKNDSQGKTMINKKNRIIFNSQDKSKDILNNNEHIINYKKKSIIKSYNKKNIVIKVLILMIVMLE